MWLQERLLAARRHISLQMQKLQGYWRGVRNRYLQKRNSFLEAKHRRRNYLRHLGEKTRGIWDSIYERTKVEAILRSRKRSEKGSRVQPNKEDFAEGGDKRAIERERLGNLFSSKDFKLFISWLQKEESFSLDQLIIPTAKPNSEMSYENYSWFLRGQLDIFIKIRNKIESDILFVNKKKIDQ